MGRSVSKASNSRIVEYIDVSWVEEEWDYLDLREDIMDRLSANFPSLEEDDKFLGREDHVIASNNLVYVGISEYCGLASLWVTPRAYHDDFYYGEKDTTGLAEHWCDTISEKFHKEFGEYNRVGGFSDGTSIYEKTT